MVFGAQIGMVNLNADFSHANAPLVSQIFSNSTLENEAGPSDWLALTNNSTRGRSYGAFLGYNIQWDDGMDVAGEPVPTSPGKALAVC